VRRHLSYRELNMSSKTLERRLAQRGTSFTALMEDIRSGLAKQYLTDTDLLAGVEQLRRSFPCREEPPGEGQRPAVPSGDGPSARGTRALQRAVGRAPALLPS
jgi:AraC-like DNA-binding protein